MVKLEQNQRTNREVMKDSRSENQLEQQVVQTSEIQVRNTEETHLTKGKGYLCVRKE